MTGTTLSDRVSALDRRVLESVADGNPLPAILTAIAEGLEELVDGWLVSILLLSDHGTHLRHGAAPSLPQSYIQAIDGSPVGPSTGSCGTAAYRHDTVIVEDIATDPLWTDYRDVALPAGLRACWSTPVLDRETVIATFAVYHRRPLRPTPEQLALIERFVHLTRVAIRHERLVEQLLRSQRLESLGTLAGGIAHDLNNVLAPITMGVHLLRQSETDVDKLHLLTTIEQSAARAARMVQQVLTFARGAEGPRHRTRPAQIVHDIALLLGDTLPKTIAFETDIVDDAWEVMVDPTQIHQVLLNLCLNARDAMPHGGTLRIRVQNVTQAAATGPDDTRMVSITVEDNGEGIPADIRDQIFDPFFTTKPPGQGTGLGLATSLGIVRSHGGQISVTSAVGHGSRFEVLLPAAGIAEAAGPEPRRAASTPPPGTARVLFVDDEPSVRLMARRVLERQGFQVFEAATGEDALEFISAHPEGVDVVLTDMMMPGMDGATLIRRLQTLTPNLPVIGMSGVSATDRLAPKEFAGLSGFLAKPYTPDALREVITRVVRC